MQIDHIVLAAPDLEQAKVEFARSCGVVPMDGGPHPGGGTHNALVSFGEACYLEIIAPDPRQSLAGTNGARLAPLAEPELLHWAIGSSDLRAVAAQLASLGLACSPIRDMARIAPDGTRLEWQLMGLVGHELGGLAPFFIDWRGSPNPATTAPVVGALESLQLGLPEQYSPLAGFLASIATPAERAGLAVRFDSPKGPQTLRCHAPKGFSFGAKEPRLTSGMPRT